MGNPKDLAAAGESKYPGDAEKPYDAATISADTANALDALEKRLQEIISKMREQQGPTQDTIPQDPVFEQSLEDHLRTKVSLIVRIRSEAKRPHDQDSDQDIKERSRLSVDMIQHERYGEDLKLKREYFFETNCRGIAIRDELLLQTREYSTAKNKRAVEAAAAALAARLRKESSKKPSWWSKHRKGSSKQN